MLARPAITAAVLAALSLAAPAWAADPVAQDDAAVALPGETIIDVLANDADEDADPLAITGIAMPAHGIATVVTTADGPRVEYEVDPA